MLIDETYLEWRAMQWDTWIEEGKIIEITKFAKRAGFTCKVVVTAGLFGDLQPFQEEMVKGHSIEERVEEMFKQFKSAMKFAIEERLEFRIRIHHMVKDDSDPLNPRTLRSSADKVLDIVAGRLIDDEGNPALVFLRKLPPKVHAPA